VNGIEQLWAAMLNAHWEGASCPGTVEGGKAGGFPKPCCHEAVLSAHQPPSDKWLPAAWSLHPLRRFHTSASELRRRAMSADTR